MIPTLIIHPDLAIRQLKAEEIINNQGFKKLHPDLLWIEDEKLGVEQVKQIKRFLELKPYLGNGQAIVILHAENLTPEAQNALLKTIEEPLKEVAFILGINSEDQLLSTITSRCQALHLNSSKNKNTNQDIIDTYQKKIEQLLASSFEERFQFIEKLDKKEEFLEALSIYFRLQLHQRSQGANPPSNAEIGFLQDLILAQKWAAQNVNVRAILEYLMLKIPQE